MTLTFPTLSNSGDTTPGVLNPDSHALQTARAHACWNDGQAERGYSHSCKAVRAALTEFGPEHSETGFSLINRARFEIVLGMFPESRASLDQAAMLFNTRKDFASARLWLQEVNGDLALATGNESGALTIYNKALVNLAALTAALPAHQRQPMLEFALRLESKVEQVGQQAHRAPLRLRR